MDGNLFKIRCQRAVQQGEPGRRPETKANWGTTTINLHHRVSLQFWESIPIKNDFALNKYVSMLSSKGVIISHFQCKRKMVPYSKILPSESVYTVRCTAESSYGYSLKCPFNWATVLVPAYTQWEWTHPKHVRHCNAVWENAQDISAAEFTAQTPSLSYLNGGFVRWCCSYEIRILIGEERQWRNAISDLRVDRYS